MFSFGERRYTAETILGHMIWPHVNDVDYIVCFEDLMLWYIPTKLSSSLNHFKVLKSTSTSKETSKFHRSCETLKRLMFWMNLIKLEFQGHESKV